MKNGTSLILPFLNFYLLHYKWDYFFQLIFCKTSVHIDFCSSSCQLISDPSVLMIPIATPSNTLQLFFPSGVLAHWFLSWWFYHVKAFHFCEVKLLIFPSISSLLGLVLCLQRSSLSQDYKTINPCFILKMTRLSNNLLLTGYHEHSGEHLTNIAASNPTNNPTMCRFWNTAHRIHSLVCGQITISK